MIYEINYPNFKQPHSKAFIALCRNVFNAAELKSRIISASITEGEAGQKEREAMNFAFVNARLVSKRNKSLHFCPMDNTYFLH
jgi:EKC/KEOPS complex subunit CGI121/TPRKB